MCWPAAAPNHTHRAVARRAFDTRARRDTGNIPAAANAARAPPSPRGDDGGPLTAMRLAAPSLVTTTSDSSDHGPKEAPLRDSPLSKAAAADRERHLNPKGTKEDPASGYVPEIPAPPSVNRCSGHRCVRHRSAPWVRDVRAAFKYTMFSARMTISIGAMTETLQFIERALALRPSIEQLRELLAEPVANVYN